MSSQCRATAADSSGPKTPCRRHVPKTRWNSRRVEACSACHQGTASDSGSYVRTQTGGSTRDEAQVGVIEVGEAEFGKGVVGDEHEPLPLGRYVRIEVPEGYRAAEAVTLLFSEIGGTNARSTVATNVSDPGASQTRGES